MYIHRAGRTGRAGASGTAITLININERRQLTRIGAHYEIEFEERPLPQDEDVQSLVSQRLVGRLEAQLRDRDKLKIERMERLAPLAKELAEDEDGLALLTMLLDDTYHEWMHQPPELPPVPVEERSSKTGSRRRKRKPRRRSGRGKSGR
jgi:ATP-dependent RNA helicase DeaD